MKLLCLFLAFDIAFPQNHPVFLFFQVVHKIQDTAAPREMKYYTLSIRSRL